MITRVLTSFLLVWAILVAPGLCGAGALAHPCDCTTGIACNHEKACAEDPCAKVVSTRTDTAATVWIAPMVVVPAGLVEPLGVRDDPLANVSSGSFPPTLLESGLLPLPLRL